MKSTQKIDLDFSRKGISPRIHAVQGDLYTRMVEISLYSNNVPWTVPEHTAVLIRYRKPDRTVGSYDTLPNGSPAYRVSGNAVTITIAPDALMLPGDVSVIVSLVSEAQVLSSFEIILTVQPNHGTGRPSEGAGGCISGILPGPESAQADQILAVEAVTPSGTVQKLKAIDLPYYNSVQSITVDAERSTDLETVYRVVMSDGAEHTFSVRNGIVGADGRSAYEYAKDGGYEGTEKEFAEKMAQEPLVVMLSNSTNGIYFTSSHSPQEIQAAYDAGQSITAKIDMNGIQVVVPLVGIAALDGQIVALFACASMDLESASHANTRIVVVDSSDGPMAIHQTDRLAKMGEIPTRLPNPNGLYLGGVVYNGEYYVDMTDTVNSMINAKLPAVPTKTSELENDSGYLTNAPVTSVNGQTGAVVLKIPETLPSAGKLTLTGAVYAEYDGTEDVTIEIPSTGADTETVLSDNLLDKSLMTKGHLFYYGSSGYTMAGSEASYTYHGFIPLRGAGTYRTKFQQGVHESTGTRIALVNDDNTWVCNVVGTCGEVVEDKNWVDFEFVVTSDNIAAGAAKIAFDVYSLYYDQTMIVKDREYPSEFIPYGYIEVATDSGKKQDNVLCGKTAVFLGDSICAGTTVGTDSEYYGYGWGGIIGEKNHMTWTNYGKNGATITYIEANGSGLCVDTCADKAISEHPSADYVIFEGGCNDADQMKDALLGEISADYATFDNTTFSGALESLILKLVTAYPYAKIGYIIPQKMYTGYSDYTAENHIHRKYFDRAVEICQKWGIPVIDIWNTTPLNPKLSTASIYYSDGIQHLTLAGYQRITPVIEAWMRTL